MHRERWPSRILFIFAAVGSAVGLGNIWRFPFLVGKYGGGAFLCPFFLMLFLVGFPLLVVEFILGQKMQKGAVGALEKVHAPFSGIGLGALLSSFAVCSYYAVVMSWALLYVFYSFDMGWTSDTETFFLHNVLQMSTGPHLIGGFSEPVVVGLIATWVMVYFCVWRGVKSVSTVIKVTMPLPIVLLIILLTRTLFLPGAYEGLLFYLRPNITALWDLEVWMAAAAQVFFTLSLGFGVMISYASYQTTKSEIIKSALIISLCDVAIAFIAGLVIFTTIGYMAQADGDQIAELAASGPSLAFIVLPRALALIPGAALLSFIFFVTLITLGIDSLFSMVEAIATFFYDLFPTTSKKMVTFFICLACCVAGLVFTTEAGIYYLDVTDHYITLYGLVLVGLLQTIAVGWFGDLDKLRNYANSLSTFQLGTAWNWVIRYFIPFALTAILIQALTGDFTTNYEGHPGWVQAAFGWGVVSLIIIISSAYSFFKWREVRR